MNSGLAGPLRLARSAIAHPPTPSTDPFDRATGLGGGRGAHHPVVIASISVVGLPLGVVSSTPPRVAPVAAERGDAKRRGRRTGTAYALSVRIMTRLRWRGQESRC